MVKGSKFQLRSLNLDDFAIFVDADKLLLAEQAKYLARPIRPYWLKLGRPYSWIVQKKRIVHRLRKILPLQLLINIYNYLFYFISIWLFYMWFISICVYMFYVCIVYFMSSTLIQCLTCRQLRAKILKPLPFARSWTSSEHGVTTALVFAYAGYQAIVTLRVMR